MFGEMLQMIVLKRKHYFTYHGLKVRAGLPVILAAAFSWRQRRRSVDPLNQRVPCHARSWPHSWPALELRSAGYSRVPLNVFVAKEMPGGCEVLKRSRPHRRGFCGNAPVHGRPDVPPPDDLGRLATLDAGVPIAKYTPSQKCGLRGV